MQFAVLSLTITGQQPPPRTTLEPLQNHIGAPHNTTMSRVSNLGVGDCGFDPWSGHTKGDKNGPTH